MEEDKLSEKNTLPEHLGGHANTTWHDEGSIDFFINKFNIKSMIDIGCGPGMQTEIAHYCMTVFKVFDYIFIF